MSTSTAPRPATDLAFPPTREAGLARLRDFVPRSGRDYAANRNHDLDGHPHVSGLSPYTRHRAVTESEIALGVLERYAPSTAQKFLQEVLWRTYFKGYLERRPAIWTQYLTGLDAARNRLATEAGLRKEWEAACGGETGIGPFDHWAREVVGAGYLHNHSRMWFASIWTHTLHLPWELGADFFLRHLLDGDAASNTLSWRWVVGLHTKGRTYRARGSNIAKFTGGRWEAAALGHVLAKDAEIEIPDAPAPPDPGPVPEDVDWARSSRTGLLLHEDDLHPDFLRARGLEPDAVAALIAPSRRSPWTVAPQVAAFTRGLAEDAVARWGAGPVSEEPTALVAWARDAELAQIVTPYAPTGPLRTALDELEAEVDIPVLRPLRAWDQAAWPHATAGYFKVKAKMPAILEAAPLDAV